MRKLLALVTVVAGAAIFAGCYGPGTYSVPTGIKPGLYHSAGSPLGGGMCTWERDDKTGNPIGSGWSDHGPMYAQVEANAAGDVNFKTSGCANWVLADGPYDKKFVQTGGTILSGTYRVGIEITPGRYYLNPQGPACHWQRLRGFRGEDADTLQEGGPAAVTVDVAPTDVGLRLTRCFPLAAS